MIQYLPDDSTCVPFDYHHVESSHGQRTSLLRPSSLYTDQSTASINVKVWAAFSSMGFMDLPPELIALVASHASNRCIIHLRRSCQYLQACVDDSFIDRCVRKQSYLCTTNGLDRLLDFLDQTRLRKFLNTLIIVCVDQPYTALEYYSDMRRKLLPPYDQQVTYTGLFRQWKSDEWLAENDIRARLIVMFERLRALRLLPTIKTSYHDLEIAPDDPQLHGLKCLHEGLKKLNFQYKSRGFPNEVALIHQQHVARILVCIPESGYKAKTLDLRDSLLWHYPPDETAFHQLKAPIASLRTLSLSVWWEAFHVWADPQLDYHNLPRWLGTLRNLCDLHITDPQDNDINQLGEAITAELAEYVARELEKTQLRSLSLTGGLWRKDGLLRLLDPLKHRLQHLDLTSLHFSADDDWRPMLAWMSEKLRLDSIRVGQIARVSHVLLRPESMVEGGHLEAKGEEQIAVLLRSLAGELEWKHRSPPPSP